MGVEKQTFLPSDLPALAELENNDSFTQRHLGPDAEARQSMLQTLGLGSLSELIAESVPDTIRLHRELDLPAGKTEPQALAQLRALAQQNTVNKSYIGMGYYNTEVPNVILRNLLENPGWYTAYTPYQPEISQGTSGNAAEFSAAGHGSDRHARCQRFVAGRSHRRR